MGATMSGKLDLARYNSEAFAKLIPVPFPAALAVPTLSYSRRTLLS
jgi:hypothetical protein